jgi:4-hydroxymandelate oxidase
VPRADLVNTLEFADQARVRIGSELFAPIAGSERRSLDRITLHPRMCVPVVEMDLSLRLFGVVHFAPILVGPIENQRRFHPDGESATVKGASAAKAAVIVSDRSSMSIAELAPAARTPLWYQIFASDAAAPAKAQRAIEAGCAAICVTIGQARAPDWRAIGTIVRASSVPVVVKGIAASAAATEALSRGARGLIVSTYEPSTGRSGDSPILRLGEIVETAGNAPVLVDGSFRRGTDVLKALAFGARAVLIGRPVMWGLAAYGADGVQGVLEMLQTELARYMGMCGKARLADLDRTIVRTHAEA